MPAKPSPAQHAVQLTFVLKGHLKNVQLSYLRVASLLAEIREQKLYAALKHASLEDYAEKRLGLGRASLYRYLQIHDWVREFHPAWLAKKPKGFIPELTDAYALMWIDRRLAGDGVEPEIRRTLERLRKKAIAGSLSQSEFQEIQGRARGETPPLRALLSSLRSARKRAIAAPTLPAALLADLDQLIERVEALASATKRVATIRRSGRDGAREGKSLMALDSRRAGRRSVA